MCDTLPRRSALPLTLPRLVFVFAVGVFGTLNAQAAPLSDLLAGASLTCGDKTFSNFRNFFSNGAGGADAPTAAEIFVNVDQANCGNFIPGPGIIIQSAKWNVDPDGSIDTAFTFDVIVAGGLPLIRDASLGLLSFDATGGAVIHITEFLFDSNNNNVANLSVDTVLGPITDTHILGPAHGYSFLTVNKDVALEGHGGQASLSTFSQNFSEVPEPGTLSLISIGVAGILVGSIRVKHRARRKLAQVGDRAAEMTPQLLAAGLKGTQA